MNRTRVLLAFFTLLSLCAHAQPDRWQQRMDCQMRIEMDVKTHQYRGFQKLTLYNNSPDTLDKLFYHLYFNAFQPGSMMDVRAWELPDGDRRLKRIRKLSPEEQGWMKVQELRQDGQPAQFTVNETILEVTPAKPIPPGAAAVLEMTWEAQVPAQIRRSGRDNAEGVAYSMAQWYPKICNYDYQGWHPNPYIGREFYGVWGDFDVRIEIDKDYMVAAGGYLQNPQEVGFGYESGAAAVREPESGKRVWHFVTPNVHDFVWAADPDFTQTQRRAQDGSLLRFVWQKGKGYDEQWEKLPAVMDRARTIMNERFGQYPYKEYAFIQGGDGGMEYPLATLITGNRPLSSLAGVSIHEQLHSWYQMILGTNESLYAWMDEGFTSYAETIVENQLAREGLLEDRKPEENPFEGTYQAYRALVTSGKEEPLTTHADHFKTNMAYSYAAYVKGAVFLRQLEYVIGEQQVRQGLLKYFDTWKFKHPNDNDLIRVMEKQSGLELDWYKEDFVHTINTIDYAVDSVLENGRKETRVVIGRRGDMAMPLDIVVTFKNGEKKLFYAPLEGMRGEKSPENNLERVVLPDHRWVDARCEFTIPEKIGRIVQIEIDPTHRLADIVPENNLWESEK